MGGLSQYRTESVHSRVWAVGIRGAHVRGRAFGVDAGGLIEGEGNIDCVISSNDHYINR